MVVYILHGLRLNNYLDHVIKSMFETIYKCIKSGLFNDQVSGINLVRIA